MIAKTTIISWKRWTKHHILSVWVCGRESICECARVCVSVLSVCVWYMYHLLVWIYSCVCALTHVETRDQHWIYFSITPYLLFETDSRSEPTAHQLSEDGWPMSFRDLCVSAPLHIGIAEIIGMWPPYPLSHWHLQDYSNGATIPIFLYGFLGFKICMVDNWVISLAFRFLINHTIQNSMLGCFKQNTQLLSHFLSI